MPKRIKKQDHLNTSLDFSEDIALESDDDLAAFNDQVIKKHGALDPSDFKIVKSEKLHDVVCIVKEGVKLPKRKDKNGNYHEIRKYQDVMIYKQREVNLLKGKSDNMLQLVHAVKDMFGGEVVPIVKPKKQRTADDWPVYDKINHRFASESKRVVYSTDPLPPRDFVILPAGCTTDPTEEELQDWYGGEQGVGDVVVSERTDDDWWFSQ